MSKNKFYNIKPKNCNIFRAKSTYIHKNKDLK